MANGELTNMLVVLALLGLQVNRFL
jgi:hypothetical protein